MPSAQVIDFGADPYANAMGSFAKNFLGEINQKAGQRRNEEIFEKIKSKYGKDASPEKIFKDVLEAEGFDQEYKRNKLDEIKDYASLSAKTNMTPYEKGMLEVRQAELLIKQKEDKDKPITPYQKSVLKNQETRLAQDKTRLEQAAKENDKKFPKMLDDYTTALLKDGDIRLNPHDKAELNDFMSQMMEDKSNPVTINQAFNTALEYIEARREKVETIQLAERPSPWMGEPSPSELQDGMEKAYAQLKALYEEDGVDSQKDLRAVAKRAGWKDDEIKMMLQRLFQVNGKSLKGPKGNKPQGSQQGKAAEAAGLDDILFGE